MKMRKLLALLLVLVLCVSLLAGCGQKEDPKPADEPTGEDTGEDTEEPSGEDVSTVEVEYEEYVKYPEFDMGELTIELGTAEGGEIGHDVYAGTAGKDYTDEAHYTLNDYIEETKRDIPNDVSIDGPIPISLNNLPRFNQIDLHHVVRMLFSCLVDADSWDTESFMEP